MGGQLSNLSIRESSSFSWTIADFCSWEDRFAFVSTSKSFRSLTNDDLFWRYLSGRLAIENGVYVPTTVPKNIRTFKNLFRELYPLRRMWEETMSNEEMEALSSALTMPRIHTNNGEKNKIQVYARFKPKKNNNKDPNSDSSHDADAAHPNDTNEEKEVEVTLPLHQRLAMIKMSHNLTSNRQALRVLTSEGGWFQSRWCDIAQRAEQRPDPQPQLPSTEPSLSSSSTPSDNQENEHVIDRGVIQIAPATDKKSKETLGESSINVVDNKLHDNNVVNSSNVNSTLPVDLSTLSLEGSNMKLPVGTSSSTTAGLNGKGRRGKDTALAFETDERYILGRTHDNEASIRQTVLPSSFTVRKGKSAGTVKPSLGYILPRPLSQHSSCSLVHYFVSHIHTHTHGYSTQSPLNPFSTPPPSHLNPFSTSPLPPPLPPSQQTQSQPVCNLSTPAPAASS